VEGSRANVLAEERLAMVVSPYSSTERKLEESPRTWTRKAVVDVLQVEVELDGPAGAEPALLPGVDVGLDAAVEVAFENVGGEEDVGMTDDVGITDEDVKRIEVDEEG